MGDINIPEIKTGSSSSKPPTNGDGGPIIKESQESEEYQQDLQVVLATAFGVIAIVGIVAVMMLLYRVYKARQRALAYTQNDAVSIDRNVSIDIDGKSQSLILLLYSYDCPLHQRVLEALAGFLMEVCGVTVTLDILEEMEIAERGIDDWLVDRLQEADYILVVCSLGARLRCSKKHIRFKHDGQHILPDYFAVAVDYVAEKMRVERQKGMSTNKFMVAYMDYSTHSDIPPQLETATQFCLMRDIHKLHTHLNAHGPESEKSESGSQQAGGDCESYYHESETGALLKATIEQTSDFFKENPSWMADRLENTTVPHFVSKGGKSRKRRRSSLEQPLLVLTSSPWNRTPQESGGGKIKETAPQYNFVHSSGVDLTCPSSSIPQPGGDISGCAKHTLSNFVMGQNRQNSLPSSLTSCGLSVTHKRALTSKSMDSFCTGLCPRADHEGVPCPYCGSCHMDGRPECKYQKRPVSMTHQASQESLSNNLHQNDINNSRSQTVLRAEVHQEWGTPVRHRLDRKSHTFGGEIRTQLTATPAVAYQSLPPNHPPPPNSMTEWSSDDRADKMPGWRSGVHDFLQHTGPADRDTFVGGRRLSQSSVFTDDSCASIGSDTDSLERDLRSIQNISSFHDFVSSSSFVSRNASIWHEPLSISSHISCPQSSRLSQKDFYRLSGADIELNEMTNSPIV